MTMAMTPVEPKQGMTFFVVDRHSGEITEEFREGPFFTNRADAAKFSRQILEQRIFDCEREMLRIRDLLA
jgi:hypothetical protein